MPRSRLDRFAKRTLDIAVSATGLMLLAPAMVVVAAAVRVALGSPVLFRQTRPGRNGAPFVLHKFRTMVDATSPDGSPLPDSARLTPFGALLRSTSLDELPQLWNVFRGEMSLVGPRPLLMRYNDRYSRRQARRLEATPGITGWAQIHGRNALDWNEKLELDVWYVEHESFCLDLRILAKTAHVVLLRQGISSRSDATMPEFFGTQTNNG